MPIAVAGATAPDWLEFVIRLAGHHCEHRGRTHIASSWIVAMIIGLLPGLNWHWVIFTFCYGGLTHLFCDSLTPSGIPITWWSQSRTHIFGGRFKTGQPGEYIAGFGIAIFCAVFIGTVDIAGNSPFFRNYPAQYEEGLIDLHEWREHRFEIF